VLNSRRSLFATANSNGWVRPCVTRFSEYGKAILSKQPIKPRDAFRHVFALNGASDMGEIDI